MAIGLCGDRIELVKTRLRVLTIQMLLTSGVSHREIERRTGGGSQVRIPLIVTDDSG